ncbi:probable RNA methyltransferase At5g51130 isoform X1 [Typha angustifolia]|uniref:probable RNA methyltransferase At5g51130 isoform X1 n=1 Tax=Typha angustifolia TaxID=59011 RepID=UPI003C2D021D
MAAEAQGDKKPKEAKSRKRKEVFIYGNYKNYYGYRIDRNVNEDPRLAIFKREWFEGKDCLDIGCNQGLITVTIARKFLCRSIHGIDIDADLIEAAYWHLRKMARLDNINRRTRVSEMPVLDSPSCLGKKSSQTSNGKTDTSKCGVFPDRQGDLFKIVSFSCENFVESLHGCSIEKYDTVLCLSVTKWIHLNWGDDGLITLFTKIWKLLRPGGILLLEPQPWTSYKRNRVVSDTTKANYNIILLHPEKFQEILLDKVGFRTADVITDNLSGTVTGFDRPIIAFRK